VCKVQTLVPSAARISGEHKSEAPRVTISSLGRWFGLGGGRSGGGDSSRRHGSGSGEYEEERSKHVSSEVAKKWAAKLYTKYGQRPVPSLVPYANYGEGSSASRCRSCSPSPSSDEDTFEPKDDTPAKKVFVPEDFVNDNEAKRRAVELALCESEEVAAAARQAKKAE
jgi:hypothetical protein